MIFWRYLTRWPGWRGELLALWRLAWPILVGQLATMGMSVVDVAMAGHASAQDLAGVSLGVSLWNLAMIGLMGLMMSVNPTVAHLVGAQRWGEVAPLVRQALWKAALAGSVAAALTFWAAEVFHHMALEPYVREVAVGFTRLTALSLPAFAAYRVLYGYSTSLHHTRPLMVIALASLLLNVAVNGVLVFGLWGAPRLGGMGCAWATLATVAFNLVALVVWMAKDPAYHRTWPLDAWCWPRWSHIQPLLVLGLPIGITYFAESSAFSLIALLVAEQGSLQVAAHQIALNFSALVFMVPLSLGLALLTRVGHSLGAGDAVLARRQSWLGVGLGWCVALFSATLMATQNEAIARLYTRDPAVMALTAQLLVLAAVFQFSDATQVVTSCAVRGYQVTRPPMLIHLTAFWAFSLPLGYALGSDPSWLGAWGPAAPLGARGYWVGLVVGLTLAALGLLVLLRRVARRAIPTR